MAQFRGTLRGSRDNTISRLGGKSSGLETTCNGWYVGVKCVAHHNEKLGLDEIHIYRTGGSAGGAPTDLVAVVTEK